MPWARASTAAGSTSEVSIALITPSDWSWGVEGTLAVIRFPSERATRSVNVQPKSTPRRAAPLMRVCSRLISSLLLDQASFLGLLVVDVLAVGFGCQGVAEDAQRADGGDVEGDQERAARGVEGGGDDGCKGAAEDTGDLVAEGCARVAHARAEKLRVEARLNAV